MPRRTALLVAAALCVAFAAGGALAQDDQKLNLPAAPAEGRFTMSYDRVWPTSPGEPHICLWGDDRYAAVSITIDDNCAPDHDWWVQQGQMYGWRFTWFVVTGGVSGSNPGFNGTWEDFQALHDLGHDINSHTVHHNCNVDDEPDAYAHAEYADSQAAVRTNIPKATCWTMAYPCGAGPRDIAAEYFLASRGVYGAPNRANKINYQSVNTCNIRPDTVDMLLTGVHASTAWLSNPANRRAWLSPVYHYVRAGHTPEEKDANQAEVAAQLAHLHTRNDQIWVAPFSEVARYAQERDSATLTVTENTPQQIRFTLSDQMRDDVFDFPLTVKVRLPAGWSTASAVQAGQDVEVTTADHEGDLFALVKAVPDRGEVTLTELPLSFQAVGWFLVADHAGQGAIACEVTDGYVEPRAAGIRRIRIGTSRPVDPATATAAAVTITGAANGDQAALVDTLEVSPDGMTLTVSLSAPLPDADAYTIGLTAALQSTEGETLVGDVDMTLAALAGDVDASGTVAEADVVALRAQGGQSATPTACRYDLDGSGDVTGADQMLVRARIGNHLP